MTESARHIATQDEPLSTHRDDSEGSTTLSAGTAEAFAKGSLDTEGVIQSFEQPARVLSNLGSILFVTTLDYVVRIWNARVSEVLDRQPNEVIGCNLGNYPIGWDWPKIRHALEHADSDPIRLDDVPFKNPSGRSGILAFTVTVLRNAQGRPIGLVWFGAEVSERRRRQLNEVKSQKLVALGRLAAELAHEMNTPLQYVIDNVRFLRRTVVALGPNADAEVKNDPEKHETELRYLLAEAPEVVDQTLSGLEHLTRVARTLAALVSTHASTDEGKASIREVVSDALGRVKQEDSSLIPIVLHLEQLPNDKDVGHSRLLGEVFRCSLLAVIEAASVRFGGNASKSAEVVIEGTCAETEVNIEVLAREAIRGDETPRNCSNDDSCVQDGDYEIGHGLAVARAVMIERLGGRLSLTTRSGEILRVSLSVPV